MNRWLLPLISSLGALLLITAGGWTLGDQSLWAFSFLIYLPLPIRLLLASLLLLIPLLLLLVPTLCVGMQVGRSASPLPNHQVILYLALAALLFWVGREQSYHGDALLKLQLLATETMRTDPYVWKEPLDSFITYTLTAFIQRWHGSPATAVALLSVLAGVVYVAAVIGLIRLVAVTRLQQISYAVALFALGSSQLWFGHIENYSLVTAATFVTLVVAIGYLKERVRVGWVGLAAGVAVSFHPQAFFAMPALLFLCLSNRSKDFSLSPTKQKTKVFTTVQRLLLLGSSALVAPLLTVALLWLAGAPLPQVGNGYAGDPQLFWRLDQAFAPNRLLDALNNLWLIAPLAPLWLAVGGWGFTKATLRQDPIFRYLSVVTAGLLFYHFSFQNDLPRWRDWDLFAITGPALTLWGIYSWWGGRQSASHGVGTGSVDESFVAPCNALWPALVFAALFTTAWVGVNHYRLLLRPNPDQREIYRQYQLLDLRAMLATATLTPDTPICAEATGCERVSATTFTMPQDGDARPVIFAHAPVQITWSLQIPTERSFLWLSPALDPVAWGWGGDGVTFAVIVRHAGGEETLWSRHLTPTAPQDLDWQEAFVDLGPFAGQSVTLILVTAPGMTDNNAGDRAGWGLPWLMRGTVDWRFGT